MKFLKRAKKWFVVAAIVVLFGALFFFLKNKISADYLGTKLSLQGAVANFSNAKINFSIEKGCINNLKINNQPFYQSDNFSFEANANKYGLVLQKQDGNLSIISPPADATVYLGNSNQLVGYEWNDSFFGKLNYWIEVVDTTTYEPKITFNGSSENGFLAGSVGCLANLRSGGTASDRLDYMLPARSGVLLDEKVTETEFNFTENGRTRLFNPPLVIGRKTNGSFIFWNAEVPMDSSYAVSYKKYNENNLANYSFFFKSYQSYPWDASKKSYQGIPWRISAQNNWLASTKYYQAWQKNKLGMKTLSDRATWAAQAVLGLQPATASYENEGSEATPVWTDSRNKFIQNTEKLTDILGENKIFAYFQQTSSINYKRQNAVPHPELLTDQEKQTNLNNFYTLTHSQILTDFVAALKTNKVKTIFYVFNTVAYYNNPYYPLDQGPLFLRDVLYPNGAFDISNTLAGFFGAKPNYTAYSYYILNPAVSAVRDTIVNQISSLMSREGVDGAYFDIGFDPTGFPFTIENKTVAAGAKLLQKQFRQVHSNKNFALWGEYVSSGTFDPTSGPDFVYGDRIKDVYATDKVAGCESAGDQVLQWYGKHLFPISAMIYGNYTKLTFPDQLYWNPKYTKNSNGECVLTAAGTTDLENIQEHKVRDYYERSGWAGLTFSLDGTYALVSESIANSSYGIPRIIRENALIFSKRDLRVAVPDQFSDEDLSFYQSKEGTWFKFKKIFEGGQEIGSAFVERKTDGSERLCYARIHSVNSVPSQLITLEVPSDNPSFNNGQLNANKWYSLFPKSGSCSDIAVNPTPTPSVPLPSPTPSVTHPSPTPTQTITSSPYVADKSFSKGFTAFGNTKSLDTSIFTSRGLYVLKFSGATNSWLISNQPGFSPSLNPWQGYYVYNPSYETKTVSIPYDLSVVNLYKVTQGWNMLWSVNDKPRNQLQLEIGNQAKTLNQWVAENKVSERVFIIDNENSNEPCDYFKLLGNTNSSSVCPNLSIIDKIPAGKAFWVYVY